MIKDLDYYKDLSYSDKIDAFYKGEIIITGISNFSLIEKIFNFTYDRIDDNFSIAFIDGEVRCIKNKYPFYMTEVEEWIFLENKPE